VNPDSKAEKYCYRLDISTINQTGESFKNALDILMDERDKCQGRKRRYDEQKAVQLSKKEKIDKLNSMLGISSGKLAVQNFFCLTNEDLVQKANVLDEDKKKQNEDKASRALLLKKKEDDKFKHAARSFFGNKNLLRGDYQVLLKQTHVEGDSPLKNKVGDLNDQFERRKHQMDLYDINKMEDNEMDLYDIHKMEDNEMEMLRSNDVDNNENEDSDDFLNFLNSVNSASI
jgi:hypothetical protein